jgi:hypothetical protein
MNFLEEYMNLIPLLAPVDNAATETKTAWVDLAQAQECCFLIQNGLITSATGTDVVTISLEAATAATGAAEAAIASTYKKSAAAGANTWGALTAFSATGFELDPTEDGVWALVSADPAVVEAAKATARYVRISIGTAADMAAHLTSVMAFVKPRYVQATMNSATAAATV